MSKRRSGWRWSVVALMTACGGSGDSGGGGPDPGPGPESINTPTNLTARVAAGPTVRLSWEDTSVAETSFQLQRSSAGSTFVDIASLPADSVDFDDSAVDPSTNYSYRVRTIGPTMVSAFSTVVDVRTDAVPPELTIESFQVDTVVTREGVFRLRYLNEDRDSAARTRFVADRDGDLATGADAYPLTGDIVDANGLPQTAVLDFADVPHGDYRLIGVSVDAEHDPVVVIAPGRIQVRNRAAVGMLDMSGWTMRAVAERSDGPVFVAGSFGGTVTFGVGHALTAVGARDAVLALVDVATGPRWVVQIGAADETRANAVVALDDGGALVVGEYGAYFGSPGRPLPDADAVFVARHAADGSQRWITYLSTSGRDRVGDVRLAPDGTVLCTLWSESASGVAASAVWLESNGGAEVRRIALGEGSEVHVGVRRDNVFATAVQRGGDVVVAMRGADLNLVWSASISGGADERVVGIEAMSDGSFVVGGTSTSPTITFGTGGLQVATSGGSDAWLARISSDGGVSWARSVAASNQDDSIDGIRVLADDSVRASGIYSANCRFDPGVVLVADGNADAYLTGYARDGQLRFVRRFGSNADETSTVIGARDDGSTVLAIEGLADTLTIHEGHPDPKQFVGPRLGTSQNGALLRLHGHGALAGNLDVRATYDGLQARFDVRGDTAFLNGVLDTDAADLVDRLIGANPQLARVVLQSVPNAVDEAAKNSAGRRVRARRLDTVVASGGSVGAGAVDFFIAGVDRTVEGTGELRVHSWEAGGIAGVSLPRSDARHVPFVDYYTEMGLGRPDDFYWFTLNACAPSCTYPMTRQEMVEFGVVTR